MIDQIRTFLAAFSLPSFTGNGNALLTLVSHGWRQGIKTRQRWKKHFSGERR
jgi:hypothetical protein